MFIIRKMRQKKIKARWVIKLPSGAKMAVKAGVKVAEGEVLASVVQGLVETVDMSLILHEIKAEEADIFRQTWIDKEVAEGEVLLKKGGLFPRVITSPKSGVVRKIDEFFNFEYWQKVNLSREIKSPVAAKVAELDKGRLVLEFSAFEFKGVGLTLGKVWSNGTIPLVEKISDLNHQMKGQIVALRNFSSVMLMKAEVIGIGGILVIGEEVSDLKSEIPTMVIEEEEWDKLDAATERGGGARFLLNSKSGRLLAVVE